MRYSVTAVVVSYNREELLAECLAGIDRQTRQPDRLIIIEKGDRICQFRIMKHQPPVKLVEVESLGNPDRGGLGSTGRS